MMRKLFSYMSRVDFGPLFALLIIVVFISVADMTWGRGVFLTASNLRQTLGSAALIAVPAFGMTIIIIAAGIDLSAGTALALCGTLFALQLNHAQLPATDPEFTSVLVGALAMTILVGCACGLVNGLLISATKVVPFIVTLGTMTIFLGIGLLASSETSVEPNLDQIPRWVNYLTFTGSNPDHYLLPWSIPTSVAFAVVLGIGVSLLMHYTVFGRNVFAIGSSESTARLCGVNVPLTLVAVYTLAGFFTAIGGLLYFGVAKVAHPNDGIGLELEIIAAVVLGGGSLKGGRGSILGTIAGALIIVVIRKGCGLLSIPDTYTKIIIGVIIILAVIVDQLRHGSPEWFFRLLSKRGNS